MTFTEVALRMFPYWIMGIFMLFSTYHSEFKNLLRIEWKAVAKWSMFLCGLTIYRILVFKYFAGHDMMKSAKEGAGIIPWQATLTVFWEDACHGLPLAIISLKLGADKLWKKIAMWAMIALVMCAFGLGHVYQGNIAAIMLSLYIPYTLKKGKEVGFGTVMICHTLYDLATILAIKNFLG